jgi:predicted AAA+ superfamily ATPase
MPNTGRKGPGNVPGKGPGKGKGPVSDPPAGPGLEALLERADALLRRLEGVLPEPIPPTDWEGAHAFRWRKRQGRGYLQAIYRIAAIRLTELKNIDRQKQAIEQNTRQFMAGKPANNVLLTGARGTGKSSLIKACLNQFAKRGLRLVEVDKSDLVDLPDIVELLGPRRERFIVFCDDLSFEEGESGYKALKVALDGSIAETSENILIYATSNRRHLLPEHMRDNLSYQHRDDGEIHPGEVVEEKISLSERFGLWVSFYPFKQDEYLTIVAQWLGHFGCDAKAVATAHDEALRWALERGSRSGRVAWQFARDWAGRHPSAAR